MNRSSACEAGLIFTPGLGSPAYENVSLPIWTSLEKGMGEGRQKQRSVKHMTPCRTGLQFWESG